MAGALLASRRRDYSRGRSRVRGVWGGLSCGVGGGEVATLRSVSSRGGSLGGLLGAPAVG